MKKLSILATAVILSLSILGCGGPQKVSDKQMTLSLSYGERRGVYTGEVNEQGIPNGKGKFTTQNAQGETWFYEGDFKDGHFEGVGCTTWPSNNETKSGTFAGDRLNGQGKSAIGDKIIYEGNFENGLPMVTPAAGMNTEVSYADWTYKVTGVSSQNTAGNKQAGGKYVIVVIDATNNANTARQPGSGQFFVLVDAKGRTYPIDDDAALKLRFSNLTSDEPWYLTEVNPGLTVRGVKLIFDVPADSDINGMKLLPNDGFGKATPIQLQQ